jgi:P63C domain
MTDHASKGGKARAKSLSPEERKQIAIAGAEARWGKIPVAEYSGVLKIGNLEIPCAVLEDGTRVLTQWGFYRAIGRSGRPAAGRGSDVEKMAPFLALDNLKPFVDKELADSTKPIVFRLSTGHKAFGYRADLLPQVCEVYLRARDEGKLFTSQEKFARACDIIMRGLAHVGIVALVDEATGYQKIREENALAEILEKFVSRELRKWARRFPFAFYEGIFRLKGWDTSDLTPNSPKPLEVGRVTDDLIYKRLAPGVRAELKRLTPRNEKGYLVNKLHQHLTDNIGNPKLEKHIAVVMALMEVSRDWPTFMANVNKVLPPLDKNYELPLDDDRHPRRTMRALPVSSALPSESPEQSETLPFSQ